MPLGEGEAARGNVLGETVDGIITSEHQAEAGVWSKKLGASGSGSFTQLVFMRLSP